MPKTHGPESSGAPEAGTRKLAPVSGAYVMQSRLFCIQGA